MSMSEEHATVPLDEEEILILKTLIHRAYLIRKKVEANGRRLDLIAARIRQVQG